MNIKMTQLHDKEYGWLSIIAVRLVQPDRRKQMQKMALP